MLFTVSMNRKPSLPFHTPGRPLFFFLLALGTRRRASLWRSAANLATTSVLSIKATACTALEKAGAGKLDGGETIQQRGATPARAKLG
jgi:hypothetical protein